MEKKNFIRKEILKQRNALSQNERLEMSRQICHALFQFEPFQKAEFILNYASFRSEVDTTMIHDYAVLNQIPIFYPRVEGDEMKFYLVDENHGLEEGYQGILEPKRFIQQISLEDSIQSKDYEKGIILCPGSVFGKSGERYGYGKGFYDKFLQNIPKLLTCGLSYDLQVMNSLSCDEYDVKMDYIFTEKQQYRSK